MATVKGQLLTVNGDGTGNGNANGNYASGAEDFYIECPAGKTFIIHRMMVKVEDSGAFDVESYGNGITLTNGINVLREKNGVETAITSTPIYSNGDWSGHCFDTRVDTYGSGDNQLSARWSFDKFGGPIFLGVGDKIIVRLNDTFTGLVSHEFIVEGEFYDKVYFSEDQIPAWEKG